MEKTIRVSDVRTFQTKSGNTGFVMRDDDGNEYTTFREEIGRAALEAQGKPARIEYHEQQRNGFQNVYLDAVEPLGGEGGDGSSEAVEEVAWKTAVDAAPWLLGGEPEEPVPADELFERLQPFKDRVADDIRGADEPDS